MGASNTGRVGRNRDSEPISGFTVRLTLLLARCYQYNAIGPLSRKLRHFAGSKRRCLLMVRKDDEMFMTRSFNLTPKTTEQHLIARSDNTVQYVTNNKRFCWTLCNIEVKYWQTRSIVRPLCDSRATCKYWVCWLYGVYATCTLSLSLQSYQCIRQCDDNWQMSNFEQCLTSWCICICLHDFLLMKNVTAAVRLMPVNLQRKVHCYSSL